MLPASLIDDPQALARCAEALQRRRTPSLYLDTEFDSTRQGTTLCLVQLSDGERTVVIDPLRLSHAGPLAEVLLAPGVEWVMHAARQDLGPLCAWLRVSEPPPLFDTQVAWALLTPELSVSLAYLEFMVLGERPAKTHQVDDWKRRPLPPAQLAYAAHDVLHLPALRQRLGARLAEKGREHVVHEASREVNLPPPEPLPPLTLASFRNAWQLDAPAQAALLALLDWAHALPDERADELLAEPKIWLAVAARRPETVAELGRLKGVPRRFVDAHGAQVVELLRRAAADVDERSFTPLMPPAYATHEELWARARLELVRAHACRLLDVAPEILLPARLLERLRHELLASGDLGSLWTLVTGFRRDLLASVWAEAVRRV